MKLLTLISGLTLLLCIVLSGVILLSQPCVWNTIYPRVMEKHFAKQPNVSEKINTRLLEDAKRISNGLWSSTPYKDISDGLNLSGLNKKEIMHYEDVRGLLSIARWIAGAGLLVVFISSFWLGWRKIWNSATAFFILLGVASLIWVAINWRSLFRALHWIIFQDDSWILPDQSYSLYLFPHYLWQTMGGIIVSYLFAILCMGFLWRSMVRKYFFKKELPR